MQINNLWMLCVMRVEFLMKQIKKMKISILQLMSSLSLIFQCLHQQCDSLNTYIGKESIHHFHLIFFGRINIVPVENSTSGNIFKLNILSQAQLKLAILICILMPIFNFIICWKFSSLFCSKILKNSKISKFERASRVGATEKYGGFW